MDPEYGKVLMDILNMLHNINVVLKETAKQQEVQQDRDSITLGAPTNGQIKVYGNAADKDSFLNKVANAQCVLEVAKDNSAKK